MHRRVPLSLSLLVVVAVAVAAFALGRQEESPDTASKPLVGAVNAKGDKVKLRTEKPAKGQSRIKLTVVTGEDRNTLALVPVFINGKGPLAFAVDTGASQTVIDEAAARKIGLKPGKTIGTMQGVTGSSKAREIEISSWKADRVALKRQKIASLRGMAGKKGDGPEGLLGSDVLSRYGKVAVDYDADVLILDPKLK
ncbi:MAG: hypothetical protein AVDCRST_MAG30-3685 [uncultured Solirubrobacteraceae bacterium]|uniref:Peptidase A2 domain-containing protein n=1 Tax=uncultured Solirubrobacteraceae bacterium TaxID=1162706 RepID=A0A6J4TQY9_9ACTN|nr:MAG: hypothetical protein AVDCRST_MAG30-3685 [uncultured Solirubrobacteraceae bacterium]